MTDFDPIKAQREMISGLADVLKVFTTRSREAEQRLSEAEAILNACRTMEAFAKQMLEEARAKMRTLEEERRRHDMA